MFAELALPVTRQLETAGSGPLRRLQRLRFVDDAQSRHEVQGLARIDIPRQLGKGFRARRCRKSRPSVATFFTQVKIRTNNQVTRFRACSQATRA